MSAFAETSAAKGYAQHTLAWRHWQLGLIGVLAVAGLLGGLYLSAVSIGVIEMRGCSSGSCTKFVLSTEWAHWLGVPVGLLAAGVYAGVLTALPFTLSRSVERRRAAWSVLLGTGICVSGAAAWFIGLMYLQVQKGCGQCLIVHVVGVLMAALLFGVAPVGRAGGTLIQPARLRGIGASAMMALALLVGGQVVTAMATVDRNQDAAATATDADAHEQSAKATRTPPDPNTAAGKAAILAELKQTYGDKWDQPATTCQWTSYVTSRPGVRRAKNKLMYEVIQPSAGSERVPGPDDTVELKYQGRLWSGEVFQDNLTTGQPERVVVRELMPGLAEGVRMMTEGSRWRFYLPPHLAYGDDGLPGAVLPDSIVVFDVELVKILPSGAGGGVATGGVVEGQEARR